MKECCKNCIHHVKCKQLINGEWRWFDICTLFALEKDGWALYIDHPETDFCECFQDNKHAHLRRMNPAKPVLVAGKHECPNCHDYVVLPMGTLMNYCCTCGQKLDWDNHIQDMKRSMQENREND